MQPLSIPEWKWEHITMGFVFKLPRTSKGHDGISVIVDRLTKSAHFLPIKETYYLSTLAKLFVDLRPLYRTGMLGSLLDSRVGDKKLEKVDSIRATTEKVKMIKEKLKTAQDRQKSYANNRSKDLEFAVGDWVFLKLSPWKGVMRFKKRGKLSPRYIGPYEITECIGPVAYRLALPPELSRIHDVFHVSMLRKYMPDPSHVLEHQSLICKNI
ncbi:unnamed protein product [Prunus armeniaca]